MILGYLFGAALGFSVWTVIARISGQDPVVVLTILTLTFVHLCAALIVKALGK